jgi:cytochrome c peroxidase
MLNIAFPEVETDPNANVFLQIDLSRGPSFPQNGQGGVSVELHSDLKRHHMGSLSETTGSAADPFFITPRLWGISDTAPYLHDGRALTLREAIVAHDGEGAFASANFSALSSGDQDALLTYLDSLRTPANPAPGIDKPRRFY